MCISVCVGFIKFFETALFTLFAVSAASFLGKVTPPPTAATVYCLTELEEHKQCLSP